MQKNVTYCITCHICTRLYIGETKRFLKSTSTWTKPQVQYSRNLRDAHVENSIHDIFSFKILHMHIVNDHKRRILESFYIKQHVNTLMNECEGMQTYFKFVFVYILLFIVFLYIRMWFIVFCFNCFPDEVERTQRNVEKNTYKNCTWLNIKYIYLF